MVASGSRRLEETGSYNRWLTLETTRARFRRPILPAAVPTEISTNGWMIVLTVHHCDSLYFANPPVLGIFMTERFGHQFVMPRGTASCQNAETGRNTMTSTHLAAALERQDNAKRRQIMEGARLVFL